MEKFKRILPTVLLILFELAVGILLLINPERFTILVFIVFGCVLMLCALVLLIRFLKDRKAAQKAFDEAQKKAKKENRPPVVTEPQKVSAIPLVTAIVTFIFGAVFAFGAPALYQLTLLLVIFYGAIMIIKGIFKIFDYISLRREQLGVSALRLIVGILSVILGVVMIVFSSGARDLMFTIAAISLLAEAALDLVTLVLGRRITKSLEAEARVVEDEDTVPYRLENFE